MRRTGYGISLDVPAGWSASIVRRPADIGTDEAARGIAPSDPGPQGPGERTLPVLHTCSRPIPAGTGDFGSGLVEELAADDVFVALVEYGTDLAGSGLFARSGWPRLAPSQFSPGRMPRQLPGRSASQHFFSVGDRAFCLYTVIGSHARRMATVPRAAGVVRSLGVEPAAVMRRRGVVL
ncbi:hypothetical protein G7075_10635 [Phycicoccus sp. HDW14]|uniref:hypothetical protein n=1 Tax=Phycicoccus sp. HDW14 TaxID=2714941 RepID=UPI00140B1407|nr:hypothetical protein [Phycicoccus sp. HDW14]QIM21478.1 hypothetical protein G7075_10635 [Phycicoccus sp. HDW14]